MKKLFIIGFLLLLIGVALESCSRSGKRVQQTQNLILSKGNFALIVTKNGEVSDCYLFENTIVRITPNEFICTTGNSEEFHFKSEPDKYISVVRFNTPESMYDTFVEYHYYKDKIPYVEKYKKTHKLPNSIPYSPVDKPLN